MVTPSTRATYNAVIVAALIALASVVLVGAHLGGDYVRVKASADPKKHGLDTVLSVKCEDEPGFCRAVANETDLEVQQPQNCSKDSAGKAVYLVFGKVKGKTFSYEITPTARHCDLSRGVVLRELLATYHPEVQLPQT